MPHNRLASDRQCKHLSERSDSTNCGRTGECEPTTLSKADQGRGASKLSRPCPPLRQGPRPNVRTAMPAVFNALGPNLETGPAQQISRSPLLWRHAGAFAFETIVGRGV